MEHTLIDGDGDKQITYTFAKLTIAHEEEWKSWLRGKIKGEAYSDSEGWDAKVRGAMLADVAIKTSGDLCAFASEIGILNIQTIAGVSRVLQMASRLHHPNPQIPEDVLRDLFMRRGAEIGEFLQDLLPIQSAEKKATGGRKGGPT